MTSVQSALVADCGVAVLGGTAGVGLETASQFAEQSARVVLLGRNHERGAAACQKIRLRAPLGDPRFVRVDATDPDDTVRAEQECRSVLGSIDVLVNTTGPSDHPRLLHTIPIQFVQQRINEIILPPLHMMHAALPAMRGNGSGSIINVASDAAKVATPGETLIGAAMAAIVMFSKAAALEAKREGVRINVLTPCRYSWGRAHRLGSLQRQDVREGGGNGASRRGLACRFGVDDAVSRQPRSVPDNGSDHQYQRRNIRGLTDPRRFRCGSMLK